MTNTSTGMDVDCNNSPLRLPTAWTSDAAVSSVVFADVNSDGRLDTVAVLSSGGVSVATWNVSGAYYAAVACASCASSSLSVVTAWDVNGDGVVEVVGYSPLQGRAMTVVVSGGSATVVAIASTSMLPVVTGVSALTVFDVDGDSDVDVVVSSTSGLHVGVSSGVGSGGGGVSFPATITPTTCTASVALVAGDVDNDGDSDLFACGQLLLNHGSGGLTTSSDVTLGSNNVVQHASGGCFGDVDNDGDVDLLVTSSSLSASVLLTNNGVGGFTVSATWTVAAAAVLVDVNGDGVLDVPSMNVLRPPLGSGGGQAVYVRALGRNGVMNQYGAKVCLRRSSSGALLGCRVVDGGGGGSTVGQSPYDVHFGVGNDSEAVDVAVAFVSGHSIDKSSHSRYVVSRYTRRSWLMYQCSLVEHCGVV